VHLEFGTGHRQPLGHAQDGRNPDAAGQQQAAAGIVRQREVILRCADGQRIALLDQGMHRLGTSARSRVPEHPDQVAVTFRRVIA